jgi:hypothetical protein
MPSLPCPPGGDGVLQKTFNCVIAAAARKCKVVTTNKAIMNKIKHEELFGNLRSFLKSKGVELEEGSYTKRVQQGCELLANSINASQSTLKRARTAVDKGLDQLRQTIHEKTAPKSPPAPVTVAKSAPATAPKSGPAKGRTRKK